MLKRVVFRRRSLAPVVLLLLAAAVLVTPACRLGYEELDRSDSMLAGGDGNSDAGNGSGNAAALGGAPVQELPDRDPGRLRRECVYPGA